MTDINAAAARRNSGRKALLSIAALFGLGLAGCSSGGGSLGGGLFEATEPAPQATATPPVQAAPVASKKVAIAPIIGAPDAVAKQISDQMTQSMTQQRIAVTSSPTDRADYTLRGYIVAARDKNNTKVSYIWDVTDPAGKRVNRITGEELAAGAQASKDPWTAVTPQMVQAIASKSAASLATWLPTHSAQPAIASGAPVQPAAAGSAATLNATPSTAADTAPIAQVSTGPVATPGAQPAVATTAPRAGSPATGSINQNVAAIIPAISGAPGDGGVALTGAIQRELGRSGVSLADRSASASAYVVEGKVVMGQPKDGKQSIQIDWKVKDPKGKALGTVSQKNEVPQGSLDSTWGKTADAAAAAAAQGILKLLPQSNGQQAAKAN